MQPRIKRRTFLQLFGLPALAALWPREVQAQQYDGLIFTDSEGNTPLAALSDNNLATGIEYAA